MAKFLRSNNSKPSDGYGRVYVLKVTLQDGTILHKVGMCKSARSIDRMMEILRSFFTTFRYVPNCELRKDKKVVVPLLVEQHMHKVLEDYSYTFDTKFDGSTEFFSDIDEEVLLEYLTNFDYRVILQGRTEMRT